MNKTLIAVAGIPTIALLIGLPGYGWYASNIKPLKRAEQAIRDTLLDPDSAQFKNLSLRSNAEVCGEVNAKNRMGGYVGFRNFNVTFKGEENQIFLDTETLNVASILCSSKNK
jgi:hypothetical protein